MSKPEFLAFDSRDALASELADTVAEQLRQAVEEKGKTVLIVSGGSTPVPFFQVLKSKDLPWDSITITVADERWVEPNDADSTEKLVREHLLPDEAEYLSLAPLVNESLTDGVERLQTMLKEQDVTADVTILGMGEDGHTASLFPGHIALSEGLNINSDRVCLAVDHSPKPPSQRVTLTAPILCRSGSLILHITGEAKREAYERAMAEPEHCPIAGILNQSNTTPTIYWAA